MRIALTYADHSASAFVPMNQANYDDLDDMMRAWASIPQVTDSNFIADLHTEKGMVENKYVEPDWIELSTGRKIEDMIADGHEAIAGEFEEAQKGWSTGRSR